MVKKMGKRTAKQLLSRAKKLKPQPKAAATFSEHIAELRRRLLWVALFFVAGSAIAYNYRKPLLDIILAPLDGQKLVYLTPGGGFSFIFQISMYAGLIVCAPILIYQIHSFIKPALPDHAQRSATKVVLSATALILAGIAYGYFVAIPAALHFLLTFAEDAVTPNLTADSYLSFFLAYIGGLALLSLLPLFLMFWHWISPLSPGGLLKSERWVIIFAFVAAAIITPTPDVVNQTMIAGPIIAIYQLGTMAVAISLYRRRKAGKRAMQQAARTKASEPASHYRRREGLRPIEASELMTIPVLRTSAATLQPAPLATKQLQPSAKLPPVAAPTRIQTPQSSNRPTVTVLTVAHRRPVSVAERRRYTNLSPQRQPSQSPRQQPRMSLDGILA